MKSLTKSTISTKFLTGNQRRFSLLLRLQLYLRRRKSVAAGGVTLKKTQTKLQVWTSQLPMPQVSLTKIKFQLPSVLLNPTKIICKSWSLSASLGYWYALLCSKSRSWQTSFPCWQKSFNNWSTTCRFGIGAHLKWSKSRSFSRDYPQSISLRFPSSMQSWCAPCSEILSMLASQTWRSDAKFSATNLSNSFSSIHLRLSSLSTTACTRVWTWFSKMASASLVERKITWPTPPRAKTASPRLSCYVVPRSRNAKISYPVTWSK